MRHRQTKGAATDMFDLQPPRHISTLRNPVVAARSGEGPFTMTFADRAHRADLSFFEFVICALASHGRASRMTRGPRAT